jgi:hypothetical protein
MTDRGGCVRCAGAETSCAGGARAAGSAGGCRRSGGERLRTQGGAPGAIVRRCRRQAGGGVSRVEMGDRGVRGDAAPSADPPLCVRAEGAVC